MGVNITHEGRPMREAIQPPLLSTIARRATLLRKILDGYTSKRDLEDVLDISRSTLDRAIRCLSDEQIVTYQGGECAVTLYGQFALREYERLKERYEILRDAKSLLLTLKPELSLDPCVLHGADVILAEQPAPHAPIDRLENLLDQCRTVVGFSPVVLPRFVDLFYEHITEHGIETELILDSDLVEYLWAAHTSKLRDVLDCEHCTIHWVEETPEFGIVLIDNDRVWIGVYDDRGGLTGAIVNNDDPALTWAMDTFCTYRSQAEQVLLRGGSSARA